LKSKKKKTKKKKKVLRKQKKANFDETKTANLTTSTWNDPSE